jgi:hypothetical protein
MSNISPTIPVRKEVKESDIYKDIMIYMNNNRDVTLLLYTWKLLGIKNATYAQMISIDENGFNLDVKIGKKSESHNYKFKKPLKDATESRKVLMNLHDKASFVTWPTGIMPIIVLLVYILMFIAIIPNQDLMNIQLLENLQEFSLKIFRSSNTASIALITTLIAHGMEGIYTFYLCTQHIKLSKANSITWVALTLILGYPVLSNALYLSKVAIKNKNK